MARTLRARVVPPGAPAHEERAAEAAVAECEVESVQSRAGRISWARLLKRVFSYDMTWVQVGLR